MSVQCQPRNRISAVSPALQRSSSPGSAIMTYRALNLGMADASSITAAMGSASHSSA